MSEERLVKIETQLAFQEQTIKELNDVLYEQQKEIDRLSKRVEELLKTIPGIEAPANEKPPHY
jgi:SlyX protein